MILYGSVLETFRDSDAPLDILEAYTVFVRKDRQSNMNDQNSRFERNDPIETPDSEASYMCFTLDVDEDQAAQEFKNRHGHWPEHILEDKGMLWLGPIKNA